MADADFPKSLTDVAAIDALNGAAGSDVANRLRATTESIGGRIVFTTSFGIEDQLIAHHIFRQGLPIEVATLDTGRLFPETYALWKETEDRYGVRIRGFHPNADAVKAFVAEHGLDGFYQSKNARLSCCDIRKVEPLRRALSGASAWVTGIRADQSDIRADTRLADWDRDRRLIKIAPLFDHNRARVVSECARLGVPVNELHAKCFLSIGCAPCTRAIRPGETERAGRWWWENDDKKECGLHVDSSGRLVRNPVPA